MEPHLYKNDKELFYKYLNQARVYFEYGSGGSTYQAAQRENIIKIYSVESDFHWRNKLMSALKDKEHISFIYNDMNTAHNTWGEPGKGCTAEQKRAYSSHIESVSDVDLILIDGRFRVACCLKCFNVVNDSCVILFDDFLYRSHYNPVLKYFDIIEQTVDKRMVVLKKKENISEVPRDIIEQFETDSR